MTLCTFPGHFTSLLPSRSEANTLAIMVRLSATAALAVGSLGVEALSGAPVRPVIQRSAAPQMSLARRAQLGAAAAAFAGLSSSVSAAEPRSSPWSLSTFLDAVDADQVEKVSFAADGKQVRADSLATPAGTPRIPWHVAFATRRLGSERSPHMLSMPPLSPDGTRVAVAMADGFLRVYGLHG